MKQLANKYNFQGECCMLLTEGLGNECEFVGEISGHPSPENCEI